MIGCKQGEVVLIHFPFTDGTSSKQRPAVIISPSWYNSIKTDYILVPITSVIPITLEPDHLLIKGDEVFQSGLLSESIVNVGKIFTLDKTKVIKSIGLLNKSLKQKLIEKLQYLFSY